MNIFNDYIFEISGFHWSKYTVGCAIHLTLILKSAQARCDEISTIRILDMHLPTKSYSGTMRDISSTWIEYIHNVLWIQPTNPFKKPQAVVNNAMKCFMKEHSLGWFKNPSFLTKNPGMLKTVLLYRSKLLQKRKFLNNSNKIKICIGWFVRNICMAILRVLFSGPIHSNTIFQWMFINIVCNIHT